MEHQNVLYLVQQRTESLVAEKLRSSSLVIARLRDLIEEANRLGHSHSAIHARLQAGGLATGYLQGLPRQGPQERGARNRSARDALRETET